jgi:alpha-D-ribose 1-methylphosphonate 5-triphosphate synthase subunit PhnH
VAAIARTLADHETTLWLDGVLAAAPEVAAFLRFHTGARITADPADAGFALISAAEAMPEMKAFAQGTDAYPDRSTTLVIAVERLANDAGGLRLAGPGIKGSTSLLVTPMPRDFVRQRADNEARFPCGVDCILTASDLIAALPRTTRVEEG